MDILDQEKVNTQSSDENFLHPAAKVAPGEIILGTLIGVDEKGKPLVKFVESGSLEPIKAIATVSILPKYFGRQVALLFVNGNVQEPIVVGFVHSPLYEVLDNFSHVDTDGSVTDPEHSDVVAEAKDAQTGDAYVDGNRVIIEGKQEIVLKCGDASITLTKAGKILIRGKYLLNRSSGVNRIMGGSVQVN